MTKKPAVPNESPAPPKTQEREFTAAPTQGGSYGEDGQLLHRTGPEPDEQRMTKPEH